MIKALTPFQGVCPVPSPKNSIILRLERKTTERGFETRTRIETKHRAEFSVQIVYKIHRNTLLRV